MSKIEVKIPCQNVQNKSLFYLLAYCTLPVQFSHHLFSLSTGLSAQTAPVAVRRSSRILRDVKTRDNVRGYH